MTPNLARRDGKPFKSYPVSPAIYDEDGSRSQHHFQEPFFTEKPWVFQSWRDWRLLLGAGACLTFFVGYFWALIAPWLHQLLSRLP